MSSNLAFFAADTLGVTLFQLDGGLKAHEIRQLHLGPWQLDLPITATSDLVSSKEICFWVTLAERLPFYVIVREHEVWMFVLSAGTLKVCGAKTGFEATTVNKRIEEFKPAIRGAFRWHKEVWMPMGYTASDFTIGG